MRIKFRDNNYYLSSLKRLKESGNQDCCQVTGKKTREREIRERETEEGIKILNKIKFLIFTGLPEIT